MTHRRFSMCVVAIGGMKLRRVGGTWIDETRDDPIDDFHATWVDPEGSIFIVGGNFDSTGAATRTGVIGHYGSSVPNGAFRAP